MNNTPLTDAELLEVYKLALEHEPEQIVKALKAVVPMAQAIAFNAFYRHTNIDDTIWSCRFCHVAIVDDVETFYQVEREIYYGETVPSFPHKADCIVKLAEEFIK